MASDPSTVFMDSFADGVAAYNKTRGRQLLGWDKATQNGSFTQSFDDQMLGRSRRSSSSQNGHHHARRGARSVWVPLRPPRRMKHLVIGVDPTGTRRT